MGTTWGKPARHGAAATLHRHGCRSTTTRTTSAGRPSRITAPQHRKLPATRLPAAAPGTRTATTPTLQREAAPARSNPEPRTTTCGDAEARARTRTLRRRRRTATDNGFKSADHRLRRPQRRRLRQPRPLQRPRSLHDRPRAGDQRLRRCRGGVHEPGLLRRRGQLPRTTASRPRPPPAAIRATRTATTPTTAAAAEPAARTPSRRPPPAATPARGCTNQDTCDGAGSCTGQRLQAADHGLRRGSDTDCDNPEHLQRRGGTLRSQPRAGDTTCGDAERVCTTGRLRRRRLVPGQRLQGRRPRPAATRPTRTATTPTPAPASGTCRANHEPATTTCGDAEARVHEPGHLRRRGRCTDNGFKPATTACGDRATRTATTPTTAAAPSGLRAEPRAARHDGLRRREARVHEPGLLRRRGRLHGQRLQGGDAPPAATRSDTDCDNPDTAAAWTGACDPNQRAGDHDLRRRGGRRAPTKTTATAAGACTDNGFKPATTACGSAGDTDCDNPDHCTGTSGACDPNPEPATTTCGDAKGGLHQPRLLRRRRGPAPTTASSPPPPPAAARGHRVRQSEHLQRQR